MPIFYNTAPPTPTTKNNINDISVKYGIRDFLLSKNLASTANGGGFYPQIGTSPVGGPRIGEPVLDTMVNGGSNTQPFGLPLETEGIIRYQIAVINNKFINKEAPSLTNITDITQTIPFPNSTWPNGIQEYPTGANPDVDKYGIKGRTIDAGYRKGNVLKNLYVDEAKQLDVADYISLQPLQINQQLKSYPDVYGGLNNGGTSATEAVNIIGSVLNGQGIGLAKGGIATNFDIRSSLAGRVLGATGLMNDTKLGVIGGQQLALALANNAAFNLQQDILGTLNTQDNVLSIVKNGTLAGFRPNYKITIPATTAGQVADYTARILGFTLPKSYLNDAGSIFLSESDSSNLERANSMILNTGKGQVVALISNMNANLIGTTVHDNPSISHFRTGYAPGYKDNRGTKAINPNVYAFSNADGIIYNFITTGLGPIPEISYNRSRMIEDYGFTGFETSGLRGDSYSESNIKTPTFSWGTSEGGLVNSLSDYRFVEHQKKTLLGKTQKLFNDNGMKTIVSSKGDMTINPSQIQTSVVGGGISKGSAVMKKDSFTEDGLYNGSKKTADETYCRTWTTFDRYEKVKNLVRHSGLNTTVPYRFQTNNSTLDQYGFPKIAPYTTDSFTTRDPKPYMFSIENLAWSDSLENLLPCEIGSGDLLTSRRGRIMWFPPYNIQFSESVSTNWESNNFVGRGEPIYTYNNTERSGNLSFSIVVDHASYMNSFRGSSGPDNSYIASFFAGCVDPTTKFADKLTVSEISSIVTTETSIPQTKVVEKQVPPDSFFYYYPNDYPKFKDGYENGLSGATANDKINYNVYNEGFGIGAFVGGVTSNTPWYDGTNYGLNGWNNTVEVDSITYSGFTDPAFIPALSLYLNTKCTACRVDISSYASPQGNLESNNKLAKLRSENMAEYLKANLYPGKTKDYIDARVKVTANKAISASESSCKVGTKDNPARTDTLACKKDRASIVQFVFDETLLPEDLIEAEPVIKKEQKLVNSKVINRFYTECNYFEQLTNEDSFIFDKIREKIRYFHPAFHSTTPEGLNSRLTFLQQCTRQGRTLEGQSTTNLAFGRPPLCILRIGDFYNTKIIIDNLSIDYEPLIWDLNPEGVGVQPMMANVTISFKFIGGSTLSSPINKLQNALSFNYYANAHVYDPRADYVAKTEQGPTTNKPWDIFNGITDINSKIEVVPTKEQQLNNASEFNQIKQVENQDNSQANIQPITTGSTGTTGTTVTDEGIYDNALVLGNYDLRLSYEGTKLKGTFFIYGDNDLLKDEYDAKIQLSAGPMGGMLDIATFKLGGASSDKPGRGEFISDKDGWKENLNLAKDVSTNIVGFRILIPKFPNIRFWEAKVFMPYDCPDEDIKYGDLIRKENYESIKKNPCAYCYGDPYTAKSPYVLEGQECPLSGTT